MKTIVALVLLLAGCREELPRPPSCNQTPVVRTLYCEGAAFNAWVTYLQVERECVETSATVDASDGRMLSGFAFDKGRIILDEFTVEVAVNPTRLVVTVGEKSESIRNCEEKR